MAGSNITCRLFAAFERFKNPNLIRLAKYLPAYKGKIGLAVCCMLTAGLSSSLIATLLGRLTDAGFYQQQAWVVLAAPIGLILISLLHGGSMFGSNYLLGQVSQSILAELRRQIFHRMLHWPAETYQTNSTGLVTSKFVFEALKSSKAPTNYFTPNILRKSWSRLVVSVVHLNALAFPVAAT